MLPCDLSRVGAMWRTRTGYETTCSDPDSYKIKQENGRRGENKAHSLSLVLLFVLAMMQRGG